MWQRGETNVSPNINLIIKNIGLYIFFRYKTVLRRSIMLKASKKAKKIYKKEKPTVYELRQFISYLGWIKATDTYNFYLKHIKPYVSIQYCKRRISRYQKRVNKEVSNVVRTAMCGC